MKFQMRSIKTPFSVAIVAMAIAASQARAQDAYGISPKGWEASVIISNMNVETNPKYVRIGNTTYCNVFVTDACALLKVPMPLATATAQADWLASANGRSAGWWEFDASLAQWYANNGYAVVAAWRAPTPPSHVAIVRPFTSGSTIANNKRIAAFGPRIAQAGWMNYSSADLATGFGADWKTKGIRYFVHAR